MLAGLLDADWDLRRASAIVGTSAGALVAAGWRPASIRARTPCVTRGAARPSSRGAPFASLAAAWDAAGGSVTQRRRALGRLAVATAPGDEETFVARIAALLPANWPSAPRVVAIDADSCRQDDPRTPVA